MMRSKGARWQRMPAQTAAGYMSVMHSAAIDGSRKLAKVSDVDGCLCRVRTPSPALSNDGHGASARYFSDAMLICCCLGRIRVVEALPAPTATASPDYPYSRPPRDSPGQHMHGRSPSRIVLLRHPHRDVTVFIVPDRVSAWPWRVWPCRS